MMWINFRAKCLSRIGKRMTRQTGVPAGTPFPVFDALRRPYSIYIRITNFVFCVNTAPRSLCFHSRSPGSGGEPKSLVGWGDKEERASEPDLVATEALKSMQALQERGLPRPLFRMWRLLRRPYTDDKFRMWRK